MGLRGRARWAGVNASVALLVTAATGALLFTAAAGMLVYGETRRLISSAEWVLHTLDVLAELQRVSLLVERIDYRTHLYQATGNEEQLRRAQSSGNQLETAAVRLKTLVEDNENQTNYAKGLGECSTQLTHLLDGFTAKSQVPEDLTQRCQQTIGLMVDAEQWLLKDRDKSSQRSSDLSIGTEIGFVALSVVTLLTLFGLLLRDAFRRQQTGLQMAHSNAQLASSVEALKKQAVDSELLTSARDELQLCVEVGQVYHSASNSFGRLLAGTRGSLCMINNSRQLVEAVAGWGDSLGTSLVEDAFAPETCCGLRLGQPRWRLPSVSQIHCAHFGGEVAERYLCKPISAHGNTLGMVYVQCDSDEAVDVVNGRMDGLGQIAQLTGMAIATLNLRAKLENQSIRDSLTGLFNRHFMQISLERELARAWRRKQTLAVLMLDLDHFKKFNDAHGHAVGDMALKAVAEIFRSNVRAEDIACRYGGEEFTIILPDIGPAVAAERAEIIRGAVDSLRLPVEGDVLGAFSVSIGIAIYPADGGSADVLLRHADLALYQAKRQGRNCVEQHLTAEAS